MNNKKYLKQKPKIRDDQITETLEDLEKDFKVDETDYRKNK